jgi:hypothetical protein
MCVINYLRNELIVSFAVLTVVLLVLGTASSNRLACNAAEEEGEAEAASSRGCGICRGCGVWLRGCGVWLRGCGSSRVCGYGYGRLFSEVVTY